MAYNQACILIQNCVGIGTDTPLGSLTVKQTSGDGGSTGGISIINDNNELKGSLFAGGSAPRPYGHLLLRDQSNCDAVMFRTTGDTNFILHGNLGIGTCSPNIAGFTGKMLTINGTGNYQGLEVGTSGTTRMTVVSDGLNGYVSTRQAGMCLVFETGAASEKMRITSDGNVGIGISTENPIGNGGTYRNLLVGNGAGYGVFQGISTATATNSTIVAFSGGTTGASANKNGGSINLELDGTSTSAAIGRWAFYTNNGTSFTEKMRITSAGCIGVGTTTPSYRLHVNGTFYAAGSSQDYKQSICNYNTDSCMFMKLKPVTYQYKEEYCHLGKELKSGTQIGLIAEEVAESHPELAILVNEEDEKVVRNVDYEKLTIILLSELQKLRQEVDQLKNK
jgi:hypothetical protein